MSMGLVGGQSWFGDAAGKVKEWVHAKVEARLFVLGERIVSRAKQLAPVKTGALRDSIGFVVAYDDGGGMPSLHVQVGEPYGVYQEFGTRNIPPHPFIRPALNEAGFMVGLDVNVGFAGHANHHGLLATTGRTPGGHAGFAMHHRNTRPLSQKQLHHVETVLKPSIKAHHRGNVKRAKITVWRAS